MGPIWVRRKSKPVEIGVKKDRRSIREKSPLESRLVRDVLRQVHVVSAVGWNWLFHAGLWTVVILVRASIDSGDVDLGRKKMAVANKVIALDPLCVCC